MWQRHTYSKHTYGVKKSFIADVEGSKVRPDQRRIQGVSIKELYQTLGLALAIVRYGGDLAESSARMRSARALGACCSIKRRRDDGLDNCRRAT